ncbi:MAG: RNA methyltransferase, partial [Chitinivibrionales bacterium]|nr:RNA methyltransferase [Chitinivibrionales bacterium]
MAAQIQGKYHHLRPLRWYTSLQESKTRRQEGFFLIEGHRNCTQLLQHHAQSIDEVIVTPNSVSRFSNHSQLEGKIRIITSSQFKALSTAPTPQEVCTVVKLPQHCFEPVLPPTPGRLVLLLEDIQDPGNVGSLVRSAAALGFHGVVLNEKCCDPFSPKSLQASAGSILSVWIRRSDKFYDLVRHLKASGYRLIATILSTENTLLPPSDALVALALGNEGNGLSAMMSTMADVHFTIPINSTAVESLNVATAGAICMYLLAHSYTSPMQR